MDNNIKFDPNTGQPINNIQNNLTNNEQQNNIQNPNNVDVNNNLQTPVVETTPQQNQQMQNIPTIEQNQQQFLNNTQSTISNSKEEKKDGVNYVFIAIIFILMFAAIYFLFPFLLKNI